MVQTVSIEKNSQKPMPQEHPQNAEVIDQILALKYEKAKLLGFRILCTLCT